MKTHRQTFESQIPKLSSPGLVFSLMTGILLATFVGCATGPRSSTIGGNASGIPDIPSQRLHQNPPVLDSYDGVSRLSVGLSNIKIDDQHYCLRTYNGMLPGPTIRVEDRAGQEDFRLRLDVVNSLQRNCPGEVGGGAEDSACACEQGKTCYDFNSTNLHTHGLHVRPDSNPEGTLLSDHVLMHLNHDSAMTMAHHGGAPIPDGACGPDRDGYRCSYEFAIDEGSRYVPDRDEHEPGTFWYHAHVHGATAIQLANGMAGALLIKGQVDQIPEIRAAKEQVLMLQQIPFENAVPVAADLACDPENPEHYSINAFGDVTTAERTLVNGRLEPIIPMEAGEAQLWRLIHGGISQEILLALEGPLPVDATCTGGDPVSDGRLAMQEIAVDGITLMKSRTTELLRLDPGYRSDVFVKLPVDAEVGQKYCLVDQQGRDLQDEGVTEPRNVVAAIYVSGKRREMSLPSDEALAGVAKEPLDCDVPMPADAGEQVAIFDQEKTERDNPDSEDCPNLNVNCKLFPDIKYDLPLGATEEWILESDQGTHPFHIHVNPFTVCRENGEELEQPYWRDTLFLETQPVTSRIRSRYLGFTGAFVMHCHKLNHEDQGMMGLVEIR